MRKHITIWRLIWNKCCDRRRQHSQTGVGSWLVRKVQVKPLCGQQEWEAECLTPSSHWQRRKKESCLLCIFAVSVKWAMACTRTMYNQLSVTKRHLFVAPQNPWPSAILQSVNVIWRKIEWESECGHYSIESLANATHTQFTFTPND